MRGLSPGGRVSSEIHHRRSKMRACAKGRGAWVARVGGSIVAASVGLAARGDRRRGWGGRRPERAFGLSGLIASSVLWDDDEHTAHDLDSDTRVDFGCRRRSGATGMTIRGILAVGEGRAGIGAGISAHAAEVTYGVPGFDLALLNGSPRTGNLDISLTANAAGHGKPCDSCAAGRVARRGKRCDRRRGEPPSSRRPPGWASTPAYWR